MPANVNFRQLLSSFYGTGDRSLHQSPGALCVLMAVSVTLTACSGSGSDSDDGVTPSEVLVATYTLSTEFRGTDNVLSAEEILNSTGVALEPPAFEPLLALADGSLRQQWILSPLDGGTYKIINASFDESMAIDVVNDGVADRIQLVNLANVSGQNWTITPLDNGFCRLTNNFTGSEIALDIRPEDNQNEPFLAANGNFSGQNWRISNVNNPEVATDPIINACSG